MLPYIFRESVPVRKYSGHRRDGVSSQHRRGGVTCTGRGGTGILKMLISGGFSLACFLIQLQ